jgi:hypothetical protein
MGSSIFAIMAKFAAGYTSRNAGETSVASHVPEDVQPTLVQMQAPQLQRKTITPTPNSSPGVDLPSSVLSKQGLSSRT